MLTKEENDLLTRVEGDAPMGKMLQQHFWVPAARAASLERDGKPMHVRLFGRDFVAFRATDGRVAILDEACPHRRASLLLARNEDCALTCIFHGWKIDVGGFVRETPTQFKNPEGFARHVKVNQYPVREAGGLIWTWIGEGEPPLFPDFEFTRLPEDNVIVASSFIECNWVQGVEATVDPVHVGILHSAFIAGGRGYLKLTGASTPRYEMEKKPFGFQVAAIRPLEDDSAYLRVTTFVAPWYGFTPPNDPELADRTILIAVPVDDTHTRQFFVRYNLDGPPVDKIFAQTVDEYDPDNYTPFDGGKANAWGQDRDAMKNGHFSGFPRNIFTEDMVVQVSMGAINDRTRENLSESDIGIVHARRTLLQAVEEYMSGRAPAVADGGIDYRAVRSPTGILRNDQDWRQMPTLEDRASKPQLENV